MLWRQRQELIALHRARLLWVKSVSLILKLETWPMASKNRKGIGRTWHMRAKCCLHSCIGWMFPPWGPPSRSCWRRRSKPTPQSAHSSWLPQPCSRIPWKKISLLTPWLYQSIYSQKFAYPTAQRLLATIKLWSDRLTSQCVTCMHHTWIKGYGDGWFVYCVYTHIDLSSLI